MAPTVPQPSAAVGLAAGEIVDRWRIEEAIGSGGQGEVYRATEIETGAEVALKVFPAGHFTNPQWGRVARELEAGKRVDHPRLIAATSAGRYRGHDLLCMPYVAGEDLDRMLGRRGRLLPEEALSVVSDVAAGLAHAHSRGVVHRDISPGKVLVDVDGRAHLMDFGVALILGVPDVPGSPGTLGTPSYRAPELTSAAPGAASSDTFSLGVLAVALLTGDSRSNLEGTPHFSVEARRLLERTLSAQPSSRPGDVVSFAQGLVSSFDVRPKPPQADVPKPRLQLAAPRPTRDPLVPSQEFAATLAQRGVSLALATGSAELMVILSSDGDGVSSFERALGRVDAIAAAGERLVVARDHDVLVFRDVLDGRGTSRDGHDGAYRPQVAYYTGALGIRDIEIDAAGRVIFASGLFSCLAKPTAHDSFTPIWQPPFMTSIVAEQRGHLSGFCSVQGVPRFATLMALDGDRLKVEGGGLLDIQTGTPLASGLDHPAMPRVGSDAIWVIEVTAGTLTRVGYDGTIDRVVTLPGLATSLEIHDGLAIIGVCPPGTGPEALAPAEQLASSSEPHRTGVAIVELAAGELIAHAWFEQAVQEITGVAVLPRRAPMAIGFKTDELRHTISVGEPSWIGSSR